MVRKYWGATGMSDEKHEIWSKESIIKYFYDIENDFEGSNVEKTTIFEIIQETYSDFSIDEIKNIIKEFEEWKNNGFEDIIEQFSGQKIDKIVSQIMENPLHYHGNPTGKITNLLNMDSSKIEEYVMDYFGMD
jgi:hypothetical protein|tara:strand:- start:2815 stop:3213 length:399 start_codon:yes stop_codon:yes gene_type:complete